MARVSAFTLFLSVAVTAVLPAVGSAQAPAAGGDVPKFAGPWVVTAAELGGDPATELIGSSFEFSADTARFTQKTEDGAPEPDDHPYKLDEKTKRMLIYQEAGKKEGLQRGIYRFGTAALFLCLTAPDVEEFPTEFTSKPEFLMLKLERPKAGAPRAAAVTPPAPR